MVLNENHEELYAKYKKLEHLVHAILSSKGIRSYREDDVPQTIHNLLLMELITTLKNMPSATASDAISQSMAGYIK